MEPKYVVALDIGTSTIICHVFNSRAEAVGKATGVVKLHFPETGYVEIVPDELWNTILEVLRNAIKDAKISASQVSSLGLSTQRGTFVTWDRRSGDYFHNFITWRDMRADSIVQKWNRSILNRTVSAAAYVLYTFSRSKRFLAASVIKFSNNQITPRLAWAIKNIPKLKNAISGGTAVFGTIDTWLLHKLTGGQIYVTDFSNASATGMFDPFTQKWSAWGLRFIGLPIEILPMVVDSAGDFTHVEESLLGAKIPITCCMADQSASMFGACCFNPGDVKLTMGTGSFININTGPKPHASVLGLYPLVAWKYGGETVFMVEGNNNDTGTLILWALSAGLIEHAKETADLANSVEDTDGVFFIPAFTGLGPPINDQTAAAGFIGMKMTSTREHLVRSILEAISFGAVQLYKCTTIETSYKLHTIRLDGGVAQNNFISQLISDMTGLRLERPTASEISVLGCAFLSGLAAGVWRSKEEIGALYKVDRVFTPREGVGASYEGVMNRWEDAVKRFTGWYAVGKKKTNIVSPKFSFKETKVLP